MKRKILLGLLVIGFASCNKEEVTTNEPVESLDCDCNRVVQVNSVNVSTQTIWYYTTINDCTGIQNNNESTTPVFMGECI
jgi:hypothetical protein